MKIIREALSGTLESGDVRVKILPADGTIDIVIQSDVIKQFGQQINQVSVQTLADMGVHSGLLIIEDKGALDCVLRARIQCAVLRAADEAKPEWEIMP